MSRAGNRTDSLAASPGFTQPGFTLIELLVVLTIISVLLVFATPLLFPEDSRQEIKTAASELASALRVARSEAVRGNRDIAVAIDAQARRFISADGKTHLLPAHADMKVTTARREVSDNEVGHIRFFADGSSTGGLVTLRQGANQFHINVDWLTGLVTVTQ